jgi:hypothetical protein
MSMHDMCDTREMCEARKSRSSRACRASGSERCICDAKLFGMLQGFSQVQIGAEAGGVTGELDLSDQETQGYSNLHHEARCELNRNMEASES